MIACCRLCVVYTSADEDCKTFTADEEIECYSSNSCYAQHKQDGSTQTAVMLSCNGVPIKNTDVHLEADEALCKVRSITAGLVSSPLLDAISP